MQRVCFCRTGIKARNKERWRRKTQSRQQRYVTLVKHSFPTIDLSWTTVSPASAVILVAVTGVCNTVRSKSSCGIKNSVGHGSKHERPLGRRGYEVADMASMTFLLRFCMILVVFSRLGRRRDGRQVQRPGCLPWSQPSI